MLLSLLVSDLLNLFRIHHSDGVGSVSGAVVAVGAVVVGVDVADGEGEGSLDPWVAGVLVTPVRAFSLLVQLCSLFLCHFVSGLCADPFCFLPLQQPQHHHISPVSAAAAVVLRFRKSSVWGLCRPASPTHECGSFESI